MTRQIIVVDVETSGLDPKIHVVVEVAWRNLVTDESGLFVPSHNPEVVLLRAEPKALELNGYHERIAGRPQDTNGTATKRLHEALKGNTLAGSNPAFDAKFLRREFNLWCLRRGPAEPWHHRMLDVSAYAAGVLGIDPTELPGLSTVCERLGVKNKAPHAAMGDVAATAECFRRLIAMNVERAAVTP